MRFYLILFFCVCLFFTSCKDDRGIPKDVLPEHAMAELLTDIHIVDGSLYDLPQTPDTLAKHSLGLYMGVFRAHHIDTALFTKSIKFYTSRPELMTEIYTGITARLQKKIDSLEKHRPKVDPIQKKKEDAKRKVDSLQRIKTQLHLDSIARLKQQRALDSVQRVRSKGYKVKHKLIKPHVVPAQ